MKKIKIIGGLFFVLTLFSFLSCGVPKVISKTENKTTPGSFKGLTDTSNSAKIKWSGFFKDKNLLTLIDSALKKNQELKIVSQEIDLARNQILKFFRWIIFMLN